MVKKMQESDTENEIREAYRVFDKERTGVIAVSEMRLILSNLPEKLSEEEIEEMLATADKDGNGSFSYEEFRMMIGASLSMKWNNNKLTKIIDDECKKKSFRRGNGAKHVPIYYIYKLKYECSYQNFKMNHSVS